MTPRPSDLPEPADRTGRLPLTLRVGVTGHRSLDDPSALTPVIHEAVRGLAQRLLGGSRPPPLVVLSALAEGADRLVVRELLTEPGARFEAVLPLPPEDYLTDFAGAASKAEFSDLLSRSAATWQAPPSRTREEAYERAGRHIVDRSDVLVALWDGRPARGRGGTATVVDYAKERGVPLAWVRTTGGAELEFLLDEERARDTRRAADEFRRYNAAALRDLPVRLGDERDRLEPEHTGRSDAVARAHEVAAAWILPYFVRADALACRLHRRFRMAGAAIFLMAAASVVAIAVQVTFLPKREWITAVEVALLGVLLVVPVVSRRKRVLDRWISYRFLAERLRSAYFLAVAGTGDRGQRPRSGSRLFDPSEAWVRRALREVTAHRPAIPMSSSDVPFLRDYLSRHWIGAQISYHRKAADRQGAWEIRLYLATSVIFGITLIAAVLHMVGTGEETDRPSDWGLLLVVLSIGMPTIGAAVHGIRTQAQFRQHCQRYRRMAQLLEDLESKMVRAQTLERVREVAVETERVMREETSAWFGVMRFHDIELIS
ncbi:hypothetical protein ACIRD3_13855 [Kitasatospora sp. NPDC093550]|uniref:hypothetical protein n=1 Tax=Kitasatospora sp. NPDC093550 TaxID=3364089 RepID=UPI0037F8EB66